LPEPGILTGAPPSDLNPPFTVEINADKTELKSIQAELEATALETIVELQWGDFCRLLAKVGHAYLVATVGLGGYEPLLPEIILGRSNHLSHYVGGVTGSTDDVLAGADLAIGSRSLGAERYLVVFVQLLGKGRLPPYQVVAARVRDEAASVGFKIRK
jgi:hypothetical protein